MVGNLHNPERGLDHRVHGGTGAVDAMSVAELKSSRDQLSLDQLRQSIIRNLYVALDAEGKMGRYRLRASRELLLVQKRVEEGDPEAEGLTWWQYYAKHLRPHVGTRREAQRLLAIAKSEDPEKAEQEAREKDAQRKRNSRKGMTDVRHDPELSEEENTTIEEACNLVSKMTPRARDKFFGLIQRRYGYEQS